MRIFILGLGHIFRIHYAPWLFSNSKIKKIFLYDLNKDINIDFLKKYSTNFNNNYQLINDESELKKFLVKEKLDKIFILTNNSSHYQLAKIILESSTADVLIEKPLCFYKQQAKELFSLAKQKNIILFPAYHQFFRSETYKTIEELKKIKQINETLLISVRSGSNRGYPEHNQRGGFKLKKYTEGGVLYDLGSHFISLVHYFLMTLNIDNSDFEINRFLTNPKVLSEDFVELEFSGNYKNKSADINFDFSYCEKIKTSIVINYKNKEIINWPNEQNLQFSNLAFKNMINNFLNFNLKKIETNQYHFYNYIDSIYKSIDIIDSFYSRTKI